MTDTRDAELRRTLAVACDLDRGEHPLAWSELPPPPRISRDATMSSGVLTACSNLAIASALLAVADALRALHTTTEA